MLIASKKISGAIHQIAVAICISTVYAKISLKY
jgi:hypothetical protein